MQRVAQDWLVLNLTHGSGEALGITTGLQFLPLLMFSLWGGMIADRYSKRSILMVTQSVMGGLALILGIAALGAGCSGGHSPIDLPDQIPGTPQGSFAVTITDGIAA